MAAGGIKTVFHYVPLHSAPSGLPFNPDLVLPVTDQVSSGLVRLPVYPDLTSDDVGRVIARTREFAH
jgi:dTDP-4-amino-4,6-dideoxygalactose transaminase